MVDERSCPSKTDRLAGSEPRPGLGRAVGAALGAWSGRVHASVAALRPQSLSRPSGARPGLVWGGPSSHPPRVRRRRRTSCFVSLRRPHPQRTGSTLAVRPPRLPRRGSGPPGALGALPAGPEQIREGPRKACRAARRRGPTKKMPGPAATRRDAAPWAVRFVPARPKGSTLPSSPRLAAHPRARPSRQRSPGGRTPGPIGAGTPLFACSEKRRDGTSRRGAGKRGSAPVRRAGPRLPPLRSERQTARVRAEIVLDSHDER